jgi:hypothetical protein
MRLHSAGACADGLDLVTHACVVFSLLQSRPIGLSQVVPTRWTGATVCRPSERKGGGGLRQAVANCLQWIPVAGRLRQSDHGF